MPARDAKASMPANQSNMTVARRRNVLTVDYSYFGLPLTESTFPLPWTTIEACGLDISIARDLRRAVFDVSLAERAGGYAAGGVGLIGYQFPEVDHRVYVGDEIVARDPTGDLRGAQPRPFDMVVPGVQRVAEEATLGPCRLIC